tara:strand:+ start:584 stop:1903 length:1320 start_codon:yes stop_codon:yes gene_type:complete
MRFGFNIIRGEIHKVTKHGIWSFHHDDEDEFRGGPPGFWEIYYKKATTGSILQRLNDKLDAGTVLKKGHFKTIPNYIKNRDNTYLESASWPALVVKEIIANPSFVTSKVKSQTKAPIFFAPGNGKFLIFLMRSTSLKVKSFLKTLFYIDVWNIGVWDKPIEMCLTEEVKNINWFPLDKKSFVADPFGEEIDEKLNIFYEKFPFGSDKGILETIEYNPTKKTWGKSNTIIDESHHLSYPFILEDDNTKYIIPESYEDNNINLYEAESYPLVWNKKQPIIKDVQGIDNTIIKYNNKFWLFNTEKDNQPRQNLNIYFSDSIQGQWNPHPLNPVKTDIRSARSAGTIFESDSVLYRPSMDYSKKIEGSITVNKIITLSETQYNESPVKIIDALKSELKYNDKIHTISKVGNYTVIDGCKEQFIFKHPRYFIHQLKLILNFLKK